MHPIEPDLKIPFTLRLNDPGLTGTWDAATGAMTLEGKLDIVVITGTGTNFPLPDSLDDVGVPPLGLFARCRIDDVPVNFSTENRVPDHRPAVQRRLRCERRPHHPWTALPAAVAENGGD